MNMLPTTQIKDEPGFFGPDYDFADQLKTPKNVGVERNDTLGSVIDAVKGAAYYIDQIGFGEPSNAFTRSLPSDRQPRPMGINYFIRTGIRCSNGADMWYYVEGIPTGGAFGEKIKVALAESRLPALRGLAPGILEDAQNALDPRPVMNAVLGSGYPKCRLVELPVGDPNGKIGNPGEEPWIKGPISTSYGYPTQKRWVQEVDRKGNPLYMTKEQYDKDPKTLCPDGSPRSNCPQLDRKEGFTKNKVSLTSDVNQMTVTLGLIAAAGVAVYIARF